MVSADIIGRPQSCLISACDTMARGARVKVHGWYDTEWGVWQSSAGIGGADRPLSAFHGSMGHGVSQGPPRMSHTCVLPPRSFVESSGLSGSRSWEGRGPDVGCGGVMLTVEERDERERLGRGRTTVPANPAAVAQRTLVGRPSGR